MATKRRKATTRRSTRAFEVYTAKASAPAAKRKGATRPFTILVRFRGGLTAKQKAAFTAAADRWSEVIVGDLPPVVIDGEQIDDILIEAEGASIDGPGKILGQAGPTHLRPASAGAAAFIPAKGIMSFDSADLAAMEADGTLRDVITHEMGHVLGIGTVWTRKKLLKGAGGANPTFRGTSAMAEYGKLKKTTATPVPVENTGGVGTRDSHWRETIFKNELMTGFVGGKPNPLSRVTVASLKDLGYVVDIAKAEKYKLPDLMDLAEEGALVARTMTVSDSLVLPSIPIVLPAGSLQDQV
jgi:Leishmanolysin